MTANLKEYQIDVTSNNLYFSDIVNFYKIITIKIEDKDKNVYKLLAQSCEYIYDDFKKQERLYGNIIYKVGTYKIIYVQYDKEIIKSSNNIYLILSEGILDIQIAYNYHGREIYTGRLNTLRILFNHYARCVYISKIFFKKCKD